MRDRAKADSPYAMPINDFVIFGYTDVGVSGGVLLHF